MNISISSISYLEQEPEIAKPLLKELRRADDFIRIAVSAVYEAFSGRFPLDEKDAANCGLFVGTSFGPMETNFDVLDQVVNNDQTSPTLFSHSVFNAAAGYLTRIFNIRGNTMTMTDFFYPFFQALSIGCNAIDSGSVNRCVILQVETYSRLLQEARSQGFKNEKAPWPTGGVAWILDSTATSDSVGTIGSLEIRPTPKIDSSYLVTNDRLTLNGETLPAEHPLTAPVFLTSSLNKQNSRKPLHFQIFSNNGTVEMQMN